MKIAQVITSLGFGGAEREVARMAVRLANAGDDCEVVCVCEEGHLASEVRAQGVSVVSLNCGKSPGLTGVSRLTAYLKASRPDVAHSHLINWAPLCGRLAGVPAVVSTEHSLALWKSGIRIAFDRFVARYADKIIVVAGAIKDARVTRWRIPAEKLVLIENSIDLARFDIAVDRDAIRGEIGASNGPLVVAVGRLIEIKGHKYLIHAAKAVIDKVPETTFALLGDGPLLEELNSQAQDLAISGRFRFLGYRQDVEAVLKCSDAFVLSSLSEGTSIAVLEAMAAGVPIVATAVGGNPEVIEAGRSGLLVPAENPAALADAILEVLLDPDLASRLAKEARSRIEAEYSAETNLARLRTLYSQVLESAR